MVGTDWGDNVLHRARQSWESGYIESAGGKPRDELFDCEVFDTLLEAKTLIERCVVSTTGFTRTGCSATGCPF